jgi:DNA replication protein DnaC
MSDSITVDAARLPLLLGELRLPTVAKLWQTFTERADREGWPSARLLATLAEFELAERAQRRVQRHLLEAQLPSGKTLDSFDFATVPMVSHAHVTALASGDAWLKKGANILLFGPSGSGKSHLGAALSSRTAIACCSPARPIWCSVCKPPDRRCHWKAHRQARQVPSDYSR